LTSRVPYLELDTPIIKLNGSDLEINPAKMENDSDTTNVVLPPQHKVKKASRTGWHH
jgi:hypothetical protein